MTSPVAGDSVYREHPAVLLGGSYNALSAARSLGQAGCAIYLGLEGEASHFVTASRFVRSWMRPRRGLVVTEWLDWLTRDVPRGSVVIPCSDQAMELVAHHRPVLEEAELFPAEADDALVLDMLDKEVAYQRAAAVGVRVPRTVEVHDVQQALAAAATFELPFAIKPRHSHRFLQSGRSAPKAIVVASRDGVDATLRMILDLGLRVVLTEIVPGVDDEYCSYYGYREAAGRELVHFGKRKLRQYPVGFGSGTYHVTGAAPDVLETGAALFRDLGLRGLGNVEFKRDARDGRLTLIECNLRLTAATELVRRCGVDLADIAYRRALGLPVLPVIAGERTRSQILPARDLLALRDYRRTGRLGVRQWAATVARPQSLPVLALNDPMPSVVHGVDAVRRCVLVASASPGELDAAPGQPVAAHQTSVGDRLLRRGLPHAPSGRLARAAFSELALLAAVGSRNYRWRWRAGSPVATAGEGRTHLYRDFWGRAAEQVGAEVEEQGDGLLLITRGRSATHVWDTLVPVDDPLTLRVAGHKPSARARMVAAGVPGTQQVVCWPTDLAPARELLSVVEAVVVKPSRSGGGDGVTCGVRSLDELTAAVAWAARYSSQILVEEQVLGTEYRLLVLDGEVIGTVRRRPPTVVGDGHSTLGELIVAENGRRAADPALYGLYPIMIDLDLHLTLRRAGLGLRSVPAAGRAVAVKTAVNENGPRDNDVVTPSAALVATALAAADAVGVRLAAVEIITPDGRREGGTAAGVVVELNTTPGLHYHYQVTNPLEVDPVAARILERLLECSDWAVADHDPWHGEAPTLRSIAP